ncbi:hypothetical protein B9G55_19820 [Saccharibacillus sp. O16]|nr:hypothetical protein B9G55_19820 [Saccharibacillus sp. O16]
MKSNKKTAPKYSYVPVNPKPISPFKKFLFYSWPILLVIVIAVAYVEAIYTDWLHLRIQTAVLITITLRNILGWLIALALVVLFVVLMKGERKRVLKLYSIWLYRAALIFPVLVVLLFMTFEWHAPQTSYDLARYYAQDVVEEKQVTVESTQNICDNTESFTSCTLWVTMSDGSRYGVKGLFKRVLKHPADVQAIRVLPTSGRLIGVRTSDGWQ